MSADGGADEASAGLPCVVVVGPTATGKTRLAVALARRFRGEVISADSRQVYRGLDLGTGKDLEEYGAGAERVPVHLVDIVDPAEPYHLFRFVADAQAALRDIAGRGCLPVIAGGTGLYIHALIHGYALEGTAPSEALREGLEGLSDAELLATLQREAPDLAARVDTHQRRRLVRAVEIARSRAAAPDGAPAERLRLRPLLIGPYYPRGEVHARIAARLDARLQAGLIDEVARLHAAGLSWERLAWFGLEYRHVSQYLQGEVDLSGMRETLLARIRRFGKAQDAWLRKIEREGTPIHWLPGGDLAQALELVERFLAGAALPAPTLRLSETLYGPRGRA
ncbi:MAG: tRNA (adenosine(37)-N6)-dimethylallyltransferase MiaA [Lentisphaerae bacterium]|nr:tRNA (adenosine(37)-N6)-dimethylallyltransferase MiaA [Lentisphaerota bacterium]